MINIQGGNVGKCQVFLNREGNSIAFSTNIDRFSTGVLQPLVITLPGLFS